MLAGVRTNGAITNLPAGKSLAAITLTFPFLAFRSRTMSCSSAPFPSTSVISDSGYISWACHTLRNKFIFFNNSFGGARVERHAVMVFGFFSLRGSCTSGPFATPSSITTASASSLSASYSCVAMSSLSPSTPRERGGFAVGSSAHGGGGSKPPSVAHTRYWAPTAFGTVRSVSFCMYALPTAMSVWCNNSDTCASGTAAARKREAYLPWNKPRASSAWSAALMAASPASPVSFSG